MGRLTTASWLPFGPPFWPPIAGALPNKSENCCARSCRLLALRDRRRHCVRCLKLGNERTSRCLPQEVEICSRPLDHFRTILAVVEAVLAKDGGAKRPAQCATPVLSQ